MAHTLDALVRLDVLEEMRNDLHERVRLRKAERVQREITAERHSVNQDLTLGLLVDVLRCSGAV